MRASELQFAYLLRGLAVVALVLWADYAANIAALVRVL